MALHVSPQMRIRLRGTALARLYARGHALMYRLSGGRFGGAIRVAAGAPPPVLLLVTTGRRTGKVRTSPLIYLRDGDDLVVAASNAGHPRHPSWWLNLQTDPRATVEIGADRHAVSAIEVTGARRDALWQRLVAMYAGLAEYERSSPRRTPIVALTPVERANAAPAAPS
jgi:deazaflavin-dependent oxidoreductase (nitroreductase family)